MGFTQPRPESIDHINAKTAEHFQEKQEKPKLAQQDKEQK
jgi:hypothetical protein